MSDKRQEPVVCYCGLIAQAKAGTTVRDGVEHCNRCGLPTSLSVDPSQLSASSPLDAAFVTTLAAIPGHRVVRLLGVVSQVSATSGFTATTKGQTALGLATDGFLRAAAQRGANAVLGVSATPFGAAGGITGALGGDAVGVLLLGTAAFVEPEADAPSEPT